MEFLEKFIILTLLFTLTSTSAKTYYYEYHSPRRNFHWNIRYPQPLISFDGGWPMSPPSLYPYPPAINDEYYPETSSYQQELLVQSLNKALTKLNMLLPPNSNQQETTPFPPNTKPEVLVEALNKVIDKLGIMLASQQMTVDKEIVTEKQKQEMTVTILPNKVYESVDSAIDDLNKLFATLPEELKPLPSQNNNNNFIKPIVMPPQPFESPFVSTIVSKTTPGPLFTSDVFENEDSSTPFVPNIVSNSGVSTESNLFTSSELENTVISSSTVPSDNNIETSTDKVSENDAAGTTENLEIPIDNVTIENDMSTMTSFPDIDIRFKEKNETKVQTRQDIVFPDDDEDDVPLIDLPSRFKQNQSDIIVTSTTTQNPQLILTYKPSRPPFHEDPFPPNPTAKPQTTNLQFQTSQQPIQNSPIITSVELEDRFQSTTTTQNPQFILTYKPSRPPFHADVFPPNPTPKPDSNPQSQTTVNSPNSNQNIDLIDRFSPTTENIVTTTKNSVPYHPTPYYSTPINLEYKPTRPFYAPNPIVYPRPGKIPPGTPWPASSTERTN